MQFLARCLALSCVALFALGCEGDVTQPTEASAQEGQPEPAEPGAYADMTDRELMITVLQRMDSLEARVEREALLVQARVEDLLVGVEGGTTVGARADRQRSRGTQQCLEIAVGSKAKLKNLITILGNAFAGLGAWAGTGGTANLKALAKLRAEFDPLETQVAVKKSWCFGRGATRDPFIGNTVASEGTASANAPEPLGLESQLASVVNQLGLNEARATQALSQISSTASGLPSCRPGNCAQAVADVLPMPADFRAMLDNPRTFFQQRAPDFGDFTLDQMCAGIFPGDFGTRLDQACDLRDRVPDTDQLFSTYEALDGIQDLVYEIDDRLSLVCKRTGRLISDVNNFSIRKHGIFKNAIPWPGGNVPNLGTDCTVIRSD